MAMYQARDNEPKSTCEGTLQTQQGPQFIVIQARSNVGNGSLRLATECLECSPRLLQNSKQGPLEKHSSSSTVVVYYIEYRRRSTKLSRVA